MSSDKPKDSFVVQQLKLASSTAVILTVASIIFGIWAFVQFIGFIFGISILGAFSSAAVTESPAAIYSNIYGDQSSDNEFLAIDIKGPIEGTGDGSDSGLFFGGSQTTYGYDVKKQLIDAAKEDRFLGVILQVDSPGGTIFGSKAIADGVTYYKSKTHRPVFVHVQGMAASGAYWASAPADRILADAGTAIGSIGVIYGPFTYFDKPIAIDGGLLGGGVVTQNGIEQTYITAGTGKDAGNPFRRLTAAEQQIMQTSVNDNYDEFVQHVAKNRMISESTIRSAIGAHLYGEKVAIDNRLIDDIASKEDAYIALAKEGGIANTDFQVVAADTGDGSFWELLGARLRPAQTKTQTTTVAPKACTESISVPLAYYGSPKAACSQ